MKKYTFMVLVTLILCLVGCTYPFTPAIGSVSIPVYFLGSEENAVELNLPFSVETVTTDQLASQGDARYILIVDGESALDEEVLTRIAMAGNPVLLVGGMQKLELDVGAQEEQTGASISEDSIEGVTSQEESTTRGYLRSPNGITYSYETTSIAGIQGAYEWALDSLSKSLNEAPEEKGDYDNWTPYISRNKTVDVYHKSTTLAGRYTIRTKWLKMFNDGSSVYDYFVYRAYMESIPGNIVAGNGWGTDWMRFDVDVTNVYSDNVLDSWQPTSSAGQRSMSIGFGLNSGVGVSSSGPSGSLGGSFSMSWTYTQPDIVCTSYSDVSVGRAKWVYDITWNSNPGKGSTYLEPGCIIRVKQNRGLAGVKEEYECAYYWKNFWRWKSSRKPTVWSSVQ